MKSYYEHGRRRLWKYGNETYQDNENDFNDTDDTDTVKPQKKQSKGIDHNIFDPFGKEEAFNGGRNTKENCSSPCVFNLDKSNEKL
jgi:hypothetical protein